MNRGNWIAALCLLGVAAAGVAQEPPKLQRWDADKGWSVAEAGLRHTSGLSCPSAVWAGLGDTAPISYDTSPFAGVARDATCQYYTYWDRGTANETRLVVNLSKMPDPDAYGDKWTSMKGGATEPGTMEYAGKAYRTLSWTDGGRHRTTFVTRAEGNRTIGITFIRADTYPDEKIWPILDALFAANP